MSQVPEATLGDSLLAPGSLRARAAAFGLDYLATQLLRDGSSRLQAAARASRPYNLYSHAAAMRPAMSASSIHSPFANPA